jgi:hypothetical protein
MNDALSLAGVAFAAGLAALAVAGDHAAARSARTESSVDFVPCHLAMEGERDPVRLHDRALGELIPATMWRELS